MPRNLLVSLTSHSPEVVSVRGWGGPGGEGGIQLVRQPPVFPREQVRVDAEGHGETGMAELALDVLGGDHSTQQQARVAVPELVRAARPEPGAAEQRSPGAMVHSAPVCDPPPMPRPRRRPAEDPAQAPLPLAAGKPSRETPEQLAKRLVSRRPSPPGIPHRVELALKISLPRVLVERLTARAIREGRSIEQLVMEIIEAAT